MRERGTYPRALLADFSKTVAQAFSMLLRFIPFTGLTMQLGYTILYVDDVRTTLAFYERAFSQRTSFVDESGQYGQLDTGGTALAFCARALLKQQGKTTSAPDVKAPSAEIAFTTPDVPAAYARALAAGATALQEPQQMPWGQTVAYVADCNGFWVEICTPMA